MFNYSKYMSVSVVLNNFPFNATCHIYFLHYIHLTATDIIHGQLQRIENTLLLLVYGWLSSFYFGLFVDVCLLIFLSYMNE